MQVFNFLDEFMNVAANKQLSFLFIGHFISTEEGRYSVLYTNNSVRKLSRLECWITCVVAHRVIPPPVPLLLAISGPDNYSYPNQSRQLDGANPILTYPFFFISFQSIGGILVNKFHVVDKVMEVLVKSHLLHLLEREIPLRCLLENKCEQESQWLWLTRQKDNPMKKRITPTTIFRTVKSLLLLPVDPEP